MNLANYRKEFPALIEAGDAKKLAAIAADPDAPHHPRVAAVRALAEIPGAESVEPLALLLDDDGDKAIPVEAAKALGELRDPDAVVPLILTAISRRGASPGAGFASGTETIYDTLKELRLEAIRSLGKIGDPRALGPLVFLATRDPVDVVKATAGIALRTVGWPVPDDLENDDVWRHRSVAGWPGR